MTNIHSVSPSLAELLIAQRFDDPALGNLPLAAFLQHASRLGAQCRQFCIPCLYGVKMRLGDPIDVGARPLRRGIMEQLPHSGLEISILCKVFNDIGR